MRIIAGKLKGSTLLMPKNKSTRPLKDMVRESIFNFLAHSKKISFELERANVLDLYSGTGSFGLECISRLAAKSLFVENEKAAIKILEKNIEKLKVKKKTKIFNGDVFNIIKRYDKNFFEFQIQNFQLDSKLKMIELILQIYNYYQYFLFQMQTIYFHFLIYQVVEYEILLYHFLKT